jgi:hypothetical protein
MKVVRIEEVEMTSIPAARAGKTEYWELLTGTPGTADNFFFCLFPSSSDYNTPRHRHNFDQIRYQLEGISDYSRDGKTEAGTVGYFPEGTHYGPAQSTDGCLYLLLQFGGASGNGFMSYEEYGVALKELKKHGEFHDGVYTTTLPDGRKKNQDGYEAVWEQSRQRELVYPPRRYDKPIFMHESSFAWKPWPQEGRARYKSLGVFSECRTRIGFVEIEAGATISPLAGNTIYFAVEGQGTIEGERWTRRSSIYVAHGERPRLTATAATKLFEIGLPAVRDSGEATAATAEHEATQAS